MGASDATATSYPPVLQGLLNASQSSHPWSFWTVTRKGFSGFETPELTANFVAEVHALKSASAKANVVLFSEVTNDIDGGASAADAIAHVLEYVAQARSLGWLVATLTCTPRDNTTFQAKIDTVNAYLRANVSAVSDFPLIDVAANPLLVDPYNVTYYTDGLHLTDAGYAVIAADAATVVEGIAF